MNAVLHRTRILLWLACLVMAANVVAAPALELRSFTAKSFAEIKKAHAGRPYILAFWSVTCEPCREETMVIAELHRQYPTIPILLVAGDPPSTRPAVLRFLANYALGRIQTWQFNDDSAERLRYSVDPSWSGELPRSYFFNAAHEVTAQSGVVDAVWLKAWLEKETAAASKRK